MISLGAALISLGVKASDLFVTVNVTTTAMALPAFCDPPSETVPVPEGCSPAAAVAGGSAKGLALFAAKPRSENLKATITAMKEM
jgi:hypothetical protein